MLFQLEIEYEKAKQLFEDEKNKSDKLNLLLATAGKLSIDVNQITNEIQDSLDEIAENEAELKALELKYDELLAAIIKSGKVLEDQALNYNVCTNE